MYCIQYASNLFVHRNQSWQQAKHLLTLGKASNLALLGNIGNPHSDKTKEFVRWCTENWENVYCVPGPCELHTTDRLDGLFKQLPKNLHILDQSLTKPLQNLSILGCPLWTSHSNKINTFHSWSEEEQFFFVNKPAKTIGFWNEEDVAFLTDWIRYKETTYGPLNNVLLLTHHVPNKTFLPSSSLERERQIILHDGNIKHLFGPHVLGCLSGSGGGSSSGFLGSYGAFCGVNAAFLGPNMVPNRQYRPDMTASFLLNRFPPESAPLGKKEKFSFKNILPEPKVAIAYANSVL